MSIECRYCGEDNPDGASVCSNCGAELAAGLLAQATEVWTITCPCCGRRYEVADENSRIDVCESCEDEFDRQEISKVRPEKCVTGKDTREETAPANVSKLVLYEMRSKKRIEISQGGLIGRKGTIEQDFFAQDSYVSEAHCEVNFSEGQWRIEHVGHTNPTKINGAKLPNGIPSVIRDNDRLNIADLYFKVNVETVAARPEEGIAGNSQKPKPSERSESWVVICPVCGTQYPVQDENGVVEECTGPCRFDEIDRREIARARAVKKRA